MSNPAAMNETPAPDASTMVARRILCFTGLHSWDGKSCRWCRAPRLPAGPLLPFAGLRPAPVITAQTRETLQQQFDQMATSVSAMLAPYRPLLDAALAAQREREDAEAGALAHLQRYAIGARRAENARAFRRAVRAARGRRTR